MKVELKTILAGPSGNGQPGDVVELEGARAKALIKGGYAVEIPAEVGERGEENPEVERETAVQEPAETAVSGEQRRKPGRPRKPRSANE